MADVPSAPSPPQSTLPPTRSAAADGAVEAGLGPAASIAGGGRAMVLLDVGSGGVPPGAVGARPAARGRQRGAPTAGGADGSAARAGHGGLDPRGATMPQADAGRRRAEDVSCGPHTRRAGSGSIVAAASAPPPNGRPTGCGGGGRVRPTPGARCAGGAAAALVADARASPVSADAAGSSQRGGAGAIRGGTR